MEHECVASKPRCDRLTPSEKLTARKNAGFELPGLRVVAHWDGRRPGGHACVVLTQRAQTARFSGRMGCSQAGGRGSQVRTSGHSHHVYAETGVIPRYRA
jgi:hypothetical protein